MRLGKSEHEKEHKRVKERVTVYGFDPHEVERVSHNVYAEHECGLYGQIDTVVVLRSGNAVPVEVKYSDQMTIFRNWRKQVTAYALLLQTVFGPRVKYGLIYFPRKKTRCTVAITHDDVMEVLNDVKRLRRLLESEHLPRGAREAKCHYCEVAKLCVK
jgi:CRISPR-associated protein Cas4